MTTAQIRAALAALCPLIGLKVSDSAPDAWDGHITISIVGSGDTVRVTHGHLSDDIVDSSLEGVTDLVLLIRAAVIEHDMEGLRQRMNDAIELAHALASIDGLTAEDLSRVVDAIGGAA